MREVNKQKTKFQLALTFIHFLSAFRIFFNDFLGRRDYVWFEKKKNALSLLFQKSKWLSIRAIHVVFFVAKLCGLFYSCDFSSFFALCPSNLRPCCFSFFFLLAREDGTKNG